ncbi:uncharacterized protein LOC123529675 isoform X2 [Mercenaria mercenaria]|uniref:uncharacterized protein LOC123529675 isoform X2 n=1 Tax=Mercenaria mercenaria TaxID=6596 RepID=UPI00234E4A8A|nr:uncharacterized protein LOC123529675 isoform X2 [Mercenaria mercenaria]
MITEQDGFIEREGISTGECSSKTGSSCIHQIKNHQVSTSAVNTSIPQTPQILLAAPPSETSTELSRSTFGTPIGGTPQNYSQFHISRDRSCDCQSTPPSTEDSSVTSSNVIDAHTTVQPFTTSDRDNLLHDITKFNLTRLKHVDKPKCPQVEESPSSIIIDWIRCPRPTRYSWDDSSDDGDDDDDDDDDDEWDD